MVKANPLQGFDCGFESRPDLFPLEGNPDRVRAGFKNQANGVVAVRSSSLLPSVVCLAGWL